MKLHIMWFANFWMLTYILVEYIASIFTPALMMEVTGLVSPEHC
jgi:hypothetical protein